MMRRRAGRTTSVGLAAAGLLLGSAVAAVAASPAQVGFARFVALAGSWAGTNGHGEPIEVRYDVTSGGSAVVERYHVEGQPSSRDMVTVYHLDGDVLLLDHYCIAGNQPRMRARRIAAGAEEIDFELESVTNLATPGAGHMHLASFRFSGDDGLDSRWTYYEDGAESFVARVSLARATSSSARAGEAARP